VTYQACHDSRRGEVIGTDYCVWPAIFQHLPDEIRIVRIAPAYEILLKGMPCANRASRYPAIRART
jgi:hypothetical protein